MVQTAAKTHYRRPDFAHQAAAQNGASAENAVFTGFFRPENYTNLCIKMLVLIDFCYSSGGVFVQNVEFIKQYGDTFNRLGFHTVKNPEWIHKG